MTVLWCTLWYFFGALQTWTVVVWRVRVDFSVFNQHSVVLPAQVMRFDASAGGALRFFCLVSVCVFSDLQWSQLMLNRCCLCVCCLFRRFCWVCWCCRCCGGWDCARSPWQHKHTRLALTRQPSSPARTTRWPKSWPGTLPLYSTKLFYLFIYYFFLQTWSCFF